MYKVIAEAHNMSADSTCRTLQDAKNACGVMLEKLGYQKKDIHIITPEGKKLYLVPQKQENE